MLLQHAAKTIMTSNSIIFTGGLKKKKSYKANNLTLTVVSKINGEFS